MMMAVPRDAGIAARRRSTSASAIRFNIRGRYQCRHNPGVSISSKLRRVVVSCKRWIGQLRKVSEIEIQVDLN